MSNEPDQWAATFGNSAPPTPDIEDRVRRLEIDLRAEQARSSETRKKLANTHSRVERAKDAMEFSFALGLIPSMILTANLLWHRYEGWEFAAAWLGTGLLVVLLGRDAFSKINSI
ncbi:hypothetical protein L7H23_01095 [Sphingopyxis sp. BSN-002]|uniref:hypothetical protein n=1 Tax=Sphingopyxis sp. BSN-002 TaxID=2911495 RepID=UPI001EDA9A93|nr:hypothetical protein [Sphingopyxis sp. BSN-002]UKK84729.1 hypothetical protein L7H23_01095 [Sphingopyxis sp. BSN-002]